MQVTEWFNFRDHKPVYEGRYQITLGLEDWSLEFAEIRPFYWHWRRKTWYIQRNPRQRPYQAKWISENLYWRGVSK
jgi:hypothetical protein